MKPDESFEDETREELTLEQVQTAIAELVQMGLVVDSGRRRRRKDGSLAVVWVAAQSAQVRDLLN